MRAIDEWIRMNKIKGSVFISFDLNEMIECDEIACSALKLECPDFILPLAFDNSTTVTTMRYSVPDNCMSVADYEGQFDISTVIRFYHHILEILEICGDWYLLPSGFTFEEKHVYLDQAGETIHLMYIPDAAEKFNEQDIKHLFVSLLEKCNESSGGNIQLQLYKYFYRPKFSIGEFEEMVEKYLKMLESQPQEETVAIKAPVQVAEKTAEKEEVKEEVKEKEKPLPQPEPSHDQETAQRSYYVPKSNRSQLSQEEIEEMVKSIYSGRTVEEAVVGPIKQPEEQDGKEEQKTSVDGAKVPEAVAAGKKKNLFDNVFPVAKPARPSEGNESGHYAVMKSISTHARYDLPKQIAVNLNNGAFVIGRASRTGEPTGANYEFSAEITPISRIHAQIAKKEEKYYIEDLGSSNGTFLNGTKLEANKPYVIEDGDKIAFAIAYSKNSIEYAFVE